MCNDFRAVQTSRLSVLLDQVQQEEAEGAVRKETLLDIALCVLGNGYSREEGARAVALLAKYHLWRLADRRRPGHCRELIESERSKPWVARCSKCGRQISSEKSLKCGLGCVCRRKAGLPRTSREASSCGGLKVG